jgi:hypothetical protein
MRRCNYVSTCAQGVIRFVYKVLRQSPVEIDESAELATQCDFFSLRHDTSSREDGVEASDENQALLLDP